ncbi:restriction endonuclease subunit S [Pseudomonas aeruginosa]|uniref:restriction endonuclease subunit S n=1 Tax=Pseudomonas aeruginosa TaxID=287 RepID=UPI0012DA64F6|nr:restriction endonuclease subunit S [Pseudomonas aeruginosa]MUI17113.1 restriction endonuclease subunit S [Pseudomonas aeruginosa]
MVKEGKRTVVPKLRFPELRGGTEWESKRMDTLYSFKRNNALSRDKLNYEHGIAKNIHYGDIHKKFSTIFDITKECVPYINGTESIPDANSDDYCVKGDIIFADASEDIKDVGKAIEVVCLDGQLLLAGQHTILARPKNDALAVGFGGYVFRSARVRYQIQKEAQGTKVYAISPTRLARIKVAYPSDKREQQKIADCLLSLDEVIAAQRKKVEFLKTYKSGLMQQLFPREGETLPRLQFPEFTHASSWHSQKVASLLSKASVAVSVEAEKMYREIGIRSHGKGIFHKDPVLGKVIGEKRVFQVVQGALILNIVFAWEQAVAMTSDKEIGMIASHRFPMYLAKPGKCDAEYVKWFFLTKEGKRLLGVASPGGAGRNKTLGQKEFESLEIPLPVSVDEQTRIANCLSSLDVKIAAETEHLHVLEAQKIGLMQQLFPVLEELEA